MQITLRHGCSAALIFSNPLLTGELHVQIHPPRIVHNGCARFNGRRIAIDARQRIRRQHRQPRSRRKVLLGACVIQPRHWKPSAQTGLPQGCLSALLP